MIDQKGQRSTTKEKFKLIACPVCGEQKARVQNLGILRCFACRLELDLHEQIDIKKNFSFVNVDFLWDLKYHGFPELSTHIKEAWEQNLMIVRRLNRKTMDRGRQRECNTRLARRHG